MIPPQLPDSAAMKQSEIIGHLDRQIEEFKGQLPTLESALGAYLVGRRYGWKVLYLVHDKKTIRKYEAILGFKLREQLEPEGDLSHRSVGFQLQKKVSNFWKAVSGELKVVHKGKERTVRDQHVT